MWDVKLTSISQFHFVKSELLSRCIFHYKIPLRALWRWSHYASHKKVGLKNKGLTTYRPLYWYIYWKQHHNTTQQPAKCVSALHCIHVTFEIWDPWWLTISSSMLHCCNKAPGPNGLAMGRGCLGHLGVTQLFWHLNSSACSQSVVVQQHILQEDQLQLVQLQKINSRSSPDGAVWCTLMDQLYCCLKHLLQYSTLLTSGQHLALFSGQ